MHYQEDINTEHNFEVNMPCGSGSMDNAPDSWIYAGSKLEMRKYSFLTHVQYACRIPYSTSNA